MKLFFTPRYRTSHSPTGSWSSFRWLGRGWDLLRYKNGVWFVQYGKDPVKFVLFLPKKSVAPKFLLGAAWAVRQSLGPFSAGDTRRALNLSALWSTYENRTQEKLQPAIESSRLGQQLRVRFDRSAR